jgi:predicted nucleic acid-binding protein
MKFVLDASVAIKWVLPEPDTAKAILLRDDFRVGIHELIAPDTILVVVAYALTRAERRGLIRPGEASLKLVDVLTTTPNLHFHRPLLPRAIDISSQAQIGVYDCLYLALAEQERCQLITADRRLTTHGFPQVVLLSRIP